MDRFFAEAEKTAREVLRWGVLKNAGIIIACVLFDVFVAGTLADAVFPNPEHALFVNRALLLCSTLLALRAGGVLGQIAVAPRLYLLNEAGDFVLALRKAGIDEDVAVRVARCF